MLRRLSSCSPPCSPRRAASIAGLPLSGAKLPSMDDVAPALSNAPPIDLQPMAMVLNTDPIARNMAPPVFDKKGNAVRISIGDVDDFLAMTLAINVLARNSRLFILLPDARKIDWGRLLALAASRGVEVEVFDASVEENHAKIIKMVVATGLPVWIHNQAPIPDANGALLGGIVCACPMNLFCSGQGVTGKDYNLTAVDTRSPAVIGGSLQFPTVEKGTRYIGTNKTGFTMKYGDPLCQMLMDPFPGLAPASQAIRPRLLFVVPTKAPPNVVSGLYYGGKRNNFVALCMLVLGRPAVSWGELMQVLGLARGECLHLIEKVSPSLPAVAKIFLEMLHLAPALVPMPADIPKIDDDTTSIEDKTMCIIGMICEAINKLDMASCFQSTTRPILNDAWKATKPPGDNEDTGLLHDLAALLWGIAFQLDIPLELPETIPPTGMPMPEPMRAMLAQIMQVE